MTLDIGRARVVHPGGVISRGRFVSDGVRAAVWTDANRRAERVLYATVAEIERPPTARKPFVVTLSDGSTWEITQRGGGCGCGSPLKGLSVDDMLAEEVMA